MLGYGGLSRSEGKIIRIAHDWATLRAARSRGEMPDNTYLDGLATLSDDLAHSAESMVHPSVTVARETAVDLRYRIDLERLATQSRPVVLPGITPPSEASGYLPRPVPPKRLRELWDHHRRDPVRWAAHPDAVGLPGTDGAPLDGEGGRLPDLYPRLWADAAVAAAANLRTPLTDIDALTDLGTAVLRDYGASPVEIASVRARVLLATGRIEQTRELLDLTATSSSGSLIATADGDLALARAGVALLRGDIDDLAAVVAAELSPIAGDNIAGDSSDSASGGATDHTNNVGASTADLSDELVLLTAASLIPLAHVEDEETTQFRLAAVMSASAGVPRLVAAVLHVVEYLARAGQPSTALALLIRSAGIPSIGTPGTGIPVAGQSDPGHVQQRPPLSMLASALCAVRDVGFSGDRDHDLGGRRFIDAGPTIRELAELALADCRERSTTLDQRNAVQVWGLLVPDIQAACPVPLVDPASLATIPGLAGLALPAALPAELPALGHSSTYLSDPTTELPGVGPVDLGAFDAADSVCATVLYSLLGLSDAADLVVDRMRCLTADEGAPMILDIAAEFVRRADCAAGHGAGCFLCSRAVMHSASSLLTEIDLVVRECACAGTAHDAPRRVRGLTRRWSSAHPLVRRLINQDILLSGSLPTRTAVEYAVQGFWSVARILPRSVPLTAGALLGAIRPDTATVDSRGEPVGRGIVDATVIAAVTERVRVLPPPPPISPLGLVDHLADLADLAEALVDVGACHEAITIASSGLDAVGVNWAQSGAIGGEAGADDDGPVRLLRAQSAALEALGNATAAAHVCHYAATAAEYRGRWRLAEACRLDAAARRR